MTVRLVEITVEDVPDLHTLGRIVVVTSYGPVVVYSGKAQWDNEPLGYYFPTGTRLEREFIEYIDMVGWFGGPEKDTIEPKTFKGKYFSDGFLVPRGVVLKYWEDAGQRDRAVIRNAEA